MAPNDNDKIDDLIYDFEKLKEPLPDNRDTHPRFVSVHLHFQVVSEERLDLAVRAAYNDPATLSIWEKVETVVTNLDIIAVRAKMEEDDALGWLDLGLERVWQQDHLQAKDL